MTAEKHVRLCSARRPHSAASANNPIGSKTGLMTGAGALLLGVTVLYGHLMALPTVTTPDPKIRSVFVGNWENTLKPCQIQAGDPGKRPWMVDAANHYSGWYPAIDVKYHTRSYLFCEKNLPLVLTGWQFTIQHCRLPNGGIKITELPGNSGTVYPYRSVDGTTIAYPLRASGSIDLLLTGDMIYRFSRDRAWLKDNIPYLRAAAGWLEGWIDDQGMLESWDYDHDSLMRRGTDGTAQASAFMAFKKLAAMENVLGNHARRDHYEKVANQLAAGARNILWDAKLGYFFEYTETNNIARSNRLGSIGGVSSEYGPGNAAQKAIDGILGYGPDVVGVGAGAGQSEWATKGQTVGAWIQVNLKVPTAINRVILSNRQAPGSPPSEAFASGHLSFNDGSTVPVTFGPGVGSRAVATFSSRTASWVKFTADRMQAEGGGNAGLAEFEITPTVQPYLKHTHGMSDVNFALVGYGVATDAQADSIWRYFQAHEDAFYIYKGVACPTWTTELPETYTADELNAINPQKDRTALGRVWRHDAWMRKRMRDGDGIYKTVRYANDLYDRPSGGGVGFFGERYDLGRFTPGDDGQDSTPKYAEYPAEYNATIIGEILLGVSADIDGTIVIDPCVPTGWWKSGFGIANPGILKDRDIGYLCNSQGTSGWVRGKAGDQSLRIRLPPEAKTLRVLENGSEIPYVESCGCTAFTLKLVEGVTATFAVQVRTAARVGPSGKPTTLVAYDYEYNAPTVPHRMCPVDSDRFAGVGQIITLPPHAQDVCGVQFKVTRAGSPGRLLYRLGRTKGGSEIACGAVPPDDVLPLYELLYGGTFPVQKVAPGEKLYLTLRAERGRYPEDYYLAYGPRPGQGSPADAQGEPIVPPGQKGFPLSYHLMTSVGPADPPRGEERFAFVREITAPPYHHAKPLRDPNRKPHSDETAIDGSWTIVGPPRGNGVIDTAIDDLQTYCNRCLAVRLGVSRETLTPATLRRERVIVVAAAATLPQLAAGLKPPESYRVKVDPQQIVLCGADDRGAMRAVYYLEDVMGFTAGPYLKQGNVKRTCLFSPRITHAIAPNCTFVNDLSQPNIYSDGLLWRISHQGFNAIFLYGNLEEVTFASRVFPELNDVREPRQFGSDEVFPEVHDARAPVRRLQRLRELVDRAARFGIDVYLYYATNYHHPMPKWFYEKHPDCQGCGWGGSMCTSSPQVQQYLAETTRNLFRAVPGLKGLVMIFDSEGFFNDAVCYDRSRCPRCRNRQPEDIAAELITIIDKAMKGYRPDAELIAWSYFTRQPPWVIRTIPKLPKDVTFQAEFSKGAPVVCDGIRYVPMDYVISQIGPPECFREQARAVEKAGLKLSAKTEHAVSWELYNVPYLPIPFQFQRRIAAIRQYPVRALFTNWVLYGYVPNMPAEVLKWYSWDNEPAIDELLLHLAGQEFGAQAGPKFVEAWRHFSTAITYYPYSDSIARHPGPIHVGPAQPLYMDRGKSSGKVWCTWQNSLGWTEPWGPRVMLKYFGLLEGQWQRGIEIMERAMADVPAARGEAARREYGIAKSILCSVRSCQNVTRFLMAREKLYREPDPAGREPLLAEMRRVAEAEIGNTREALPLCEADSRIGYATVWGDMRVAGFFTPALLRGKIAQVEQMIRAELPRFDPAWTHRLPGFHHVLASRADRALLPSYREDQAWLDLCDHHKPGSVIRWETAPVPKDVPAEGVAFAFAGGLSHAAPPGGEGFALEINGKETIRFDAPPLAAWQSNDKRVELQFEVVRYTGGGDPMGLFYLKVPRNLLTPGQPCRLGVRSLPGGAARWFGLNRYNDVR